MLFEPKVHYASEDEEIAHRGWSFMEVHGSGACDGIYLRLAIAMMKTGVENNDRDLSLAGLRLRSSSDTWLDSLENSYDETNSNVKKNLKNMLQYAQGIQKEHIAESWEYIFKNFDKVFAIHDDYGFSILESFGRSLVSLGKNSHSYPGIRQYANDAKNNGYKNWENDCIKAGMVIVEKNSQYFDDICQWLAEWSQSLWD